MNFVKTENKDKQISLCYQIIIGWLIVHTPSGRNVAIHVGYTIKLNYSNMLRSFVCMTFYVEPCITLHVLQQIKKITPGLSVVVPAVSTSKVFE